MNTNGHSATGCFRIVECLEWRGNSHFTEKQEVPNSGKWNSLPRMTQHIPLIAIGKILSVDLSKSSPNFLISAVRDRYYKVSQSFSNHLVASMQETVSHTQSKARKDQICFLITTFMHPLFTIEGYAILCCWSWGSLRKENDSREEQENVIELRSWEMIWEVIARTPTSYS